MSRVEPGMRRSRRRLPPSGLEWEGFQKLLQLLHPDPEAAGRQYREIHTRLVSYFRWRRCDFPEDLADETLDRVARRLAAGIQVYSDPCRYVAGVAHRVGWEAASRRELTRPLPDPIAAPAPAGDDPGRQERERQLDLLEQCLAALPGRERRLLFAYYAGDDRISDRKRLCAELGLSPNALRLQVHRVCRRVRDLLGRRPRVTPGLQSRPAPRSPDAGDSDGRWSW